MSVPLKVAPPTFTFSGVTSTVIVVDRRSAGSCPTMLKPKVVAASGLTAVRKKCVTVLADGCGLAPPTVVDIACRAESGTTSGAGVPAALAGDARNGMEMATPAARASFPANGRIIRSPLNVARYASCPVTREPPTDHDGAPAGGHRGLAGLLPAAVIPLARRGCTAPRRRSRRRSRPSAPGRCPARWRCRRRGAWSYCRRGVNKPLLHVLTCKGGPGRGGRSPDRGRGPAALPPRTEGRERRDSAHGWWIGLNSRGGGLVAGAGRGHGERDRPVRSDGGDPRSHRR